MADQVLAVDLGGTNMRAAVVDAHGEIRLRRSQPTPREDTCPDALLGLVGGVLADHPVVSAVIGVPGRIDHTRGALEVMNTDGPLQRIVLFRHAETAWSLTGRQARAQGHRDLERPRCRKRSSNRADDPTLQEERP